MRNLRRNHSMCVMFIAAFLFAPQIPAEQSESWRNFYDVSMERLYNYEHDEAIAALTNALQKNNSEPIIYLRLAQSMLFRDKRDLENERFRQNDTDLHHTLNGTTDADRAAQRRHREFLSIVEHGRRLAQSLRDTDEERTLYLLGSFKMAEAGYKQIIFNEMGEPRNLSVEALAFFKPLLDNKESDYHHDALFYRSTISVQLGKRAPRGTGPILSSALSLPVNYDRGLTDMKSVAEQTSNESGAAQLSFVGEIAETNNGKNNRRHKRAALSMALQLIARYPNNPSIRYHTILLYRKNEQHQSANALRRETLELLRTDPRSLQGLLIEITSKIEGA